MFDFTVPEPGLSIPRTSANLLCLTTYISQPLVGMPSINDEMYFPVLLFGFGQVSPIEAIALR